jgi:tetraacyldisaccharide 4'-kinase
MVFLKLHLQPKILRKPTSPDHTIMFQCLQQLPKYWGNRNAITYLLWPFEIGYKIAWRLRQWAVSLGWIQRHRVNATVIVVGNVVAGGGGKTPLTMAIVQRLVMQGFHVGVVSRGYGRTLASLQIVNAHSLASEVGDEPLMVFQKCSVPVVVGAQRVEASRHLLNLFPAVNVLVCDDGLQHIALQRDIEICVMDATGLGNGHLLPAGPLREPWPRQIDLLLHTHQRTLPQGFESRRELGTFALTSQGKQMSLSDLKLQAVEVVSGIAKPEAFLAMLKQGQFQIQCSTALPDHDDFANWQPLHPELPLLCTEKDAVKLWKRFPQALAVPLVFEPEEAFWKAFDQLFLSRHRYH